MSFAEKMERKKVFRNTEYLSIHHVPDNLRYRDEEMDQILDEIAFQFDEGAGSNLLISGSTGTGKTHCLKKLCNDVNDYLQGGSIELDCVSDGKNPKGKMVYVPVKGKTVYDVFIKLNQEFREYPSRGFSFNCIVTDLAEYLAESQENVILVLDEVDMINDTRSTNGDPFDSLVYHTTRLGDQVDGEVNIMTVLVTSNPRVKDKINDYSLSSFQPDHIHFSSYNVEQIEKIILDRVEEAFLPGIVNDSAIGWLSATITNGYSDIRYALEALKVAGKNVVLKDKEKMTIGDLQEAIEKLDYDEVKSTMRGLNKVHFAALMALISRDRNTQKGVDSENFYKEYVKICKLIDTEPRTYSYVRKFIMPRLETQGLITSRIKGLGRGRGQILIYYVRGLEDMLPAVAEVAQEEYGMVVRIDGQSVIEGY
ncbi:MAG: AAA family ATPase [Thermoplasmata archaeon]